MTKKLPKHVAIVMDGNGRWATCRALKRIMGHQAGTKVVRDIVEYAAKKHIEVLTLFAFSLENRSRPTIEVNFLMSLFLDELRNNTIELHNNNIRLRIIGDHQHFSDALKTQIRESETLTRHNTGMTLVIAINYSGRWDITEGAKRIAQAVMQGTLSLEAITPQLFQQYLVLPDLPEPDLLIRTSGEQRLSNFMLWQFAYTEIYFTMRYWPDFNSQDFDEALAFYQTRQRRFGLIPEQIS